MGSACHTNLLRKVTALCLSSPRELWNLPHCPALLAPSRHQHFNSFWDEDSQYVWCLPGGLSPGWGLPSFVSYSNETVLQRMDNISNVWYEVIPQISSFHYICLPAKYFQQRNYYFLILLLLFRAYSEILTTFRSLISLTKQKVWCGGASQAL